MTLPLTPGLACLGGGKEVKSTLSSPAVRTHWVTNKKQTLQAIAQRRQVQSLIFGIRRRLLHYLIDVEAQRSSVATPPDCRLPQGPRVSLLHLRRHVGTR
jgi:hypothetical protein